MKTLIELYKSIAESVGLTTDNQGFISTLTPGSDTPKPWTVDSKRAVMPYDEQLQQPDWSNRIGFHPLLQSVIGGESRVMEKFRDRMNGYSDFVLGTLMLDIAKLGQRETMHQDLTPEQSRYLGPFSDVDKRFTELVYDLVTTKRVSKKNLEFVRFSVIKGRVWNGEKRVRVATMHFPLYEALPKDNKGTTILNHTLRQKDVRMLRAMYQCLFPHIEEKGFYEIGSDSKIGPSIESLMAMYAVFAKAINEAVGVLEPVIDTSTALLIVNDWEEDLKNAAHYLPEIRRIPMLEGNSPSERVVQAAAPQTIAMNTTAAPAVTPGTSVSAPTMNASMGSQISAQVAQQQAPQEINHMQSKPRIKLGVRAPLNETVNPSHQLPLTVGNEVPQTISYARPAPSSLPPTPPVGVLLQQQQVQQGLIPQQVVVQPQIQQPQVQAVKIPDTVRMVNGTMYIPLESDGVSAAPAGMILIQGKPYVPFNMGGMQPQPVNAGLGVGVARPGMMQPQQAQITDPSQVAGLSQDEINFYRSNPVMWQNFLGQLQAQTMATATNVLQQRQMQIPRYLQNAVQQAQAAQQTQLATGGFLGRRLIG